MSIQVIRDLKGLRIQVIHAPDSEGRALVDHLHRIGCTCETTWPLPDEISPNADVVMISIEPENRVQILRLFSQTLEKPPSLLAVASYEDPGTLQIIMECGALAVIDRPIRPFGLLSNLAIARNLWLERREMTKRIRKLERKIAANNRISKAKNIIMQTQSLNEKDAYESIRRQAMTKRVPMDEIASSIINAYELLTGTTAE